MRSTNPVTANGLRRVAANLLGGLAGLAFVAACLSGTPVPAADMQPGDAIEGFTVVGEDFTPGDYWHWNLKLEVRYTYNPAHPSVVVGGELLPHIGGLETGHAYWGTASGPDKAVDEHAQGPFVHGIQRIRIAVRLTADERVTHDLRLFLYEPGGNEFLSRGFPFDRLWKLPLFEVLPIPLKPATPTPTPTPSKADLVIVSMAKEDLGDGQAWLGVTVQNKGSALATGVDGTCAYTCTSSGVKVSGQSFLQGGYLVPGKTVNGLLGVTPCSDKSVQFKCVIDPANTVAESNEQNNTSIAWVTIH